MRACSPQCHRRCCGSNRGTRLVPILVPTVQWEPNPCKYYYQHGRHHSPVTQLPQLTPVSILCLDDDVFYLFLQKQQIVLASHVLHFPLQASKFQSEPRVDTNDLLRNGLLIHQALRERRPLRTSEWPSRATTGSTICSWVIGHIKASGTASSSSIRGGHCKPRKLCGT
jgi:hypothetical protein